MYVCVVIYYDYDHYDIFCEYCSERCLFDIEKVRSVYAESVGWKWVGIYLATSILSPAGFAAGQQM